MNQSEAETIALNVLNFLAGDETRLQRFMALSGLDPQDLRSSVSEPAFLAGILEYLLQDESLIYMFASAYNTPPGQPAQARRVLVGGRDSGDYY
jgi:Protein of unknown function (DUF3572)